MNQIELERLVGRYNAMQQSLDYWIWHGLAADKLLHDQYGMKLAQIVPLGFESDNSGADLRS